MNLNSTRRLAALIIGSLVVIATSGALATQRARQSNAAHREITAIALSTDGNTVATGGSDGAVKIWDAATGRLAATFRGHRRPVSSLAFSPGAALIASGSFDGSVRLRDSRSGETKLTLTTPGQVKGLAFSRDGRIVATTTADGVRLWDSASGNLLKTIPSPRGVVSVAFSPDGRMIATAGALGVRLWDRQAGKLLRDMPAPNELSLAVTFSSDGRYVAGGGTSKAAKVWDVRSGAAIRTFSGGADFVRAVAFSRDSRRLAVADRIDVCLWDIATGRRLETLHAGFRAVAVSDDGTVAGGTAEGVLKVLRLAERRGR